MKANNSSLFLIFILASLHLARAAEMILRQDLPLTGHRRLGDFDKLNQIFENASLDLPGEFQFSQKVGFATLSMTVRNIVCYDVSIGDASLFHKRYDDQNMEVELSLSNVDLRCVMDYDYKYGFLGGDGRLEMRAVDSFASTKYFLESLDFNFQPPTKSVQGPCVADVQVTKLDFEGDILSSVMDSVAASLTSNVEQDLEAYACTVLGNFDTNTIDQAILGRVNNMVVPYQTPLTEAEKNPLLLEQSLTLPIGLVAMDLQDRQSPTPKFINDALDMFSDAVTAVEDGDLAINGFLRSSLLDSNGALSFTPSELGINAVVYETHNTFVEASALLTQVKVTGLDTLMRFDPFQRLGKFTLKNDISWKNLALEMDIMLDMKPSSLPDAKLKGSSSIRVTETMTVTAAIENIDFVASLFLVVNETALDSLTLGPFLHNEQFLSCLSNIVHLVQVSGLAVNSDVLDKLEYKVSGDPGIAGLAEEALDVLYSMYKGVLESVTTAVFQRGLRSSVNELIDDTMTNSTGTKCSDFEPTAEYVDFNEFFTLGVGAYSNIPSIARDLINSVATALDQIQSVLGFLLVGDNSTSLGSISFDGPLIDTSSRINIGGLDAQVVLNARDARIENLDSIGAPIELLGLLPNDPHTLEHTATFGVSDRPVRFAIKFLISLLVDDVQLRNDLDISVDAHSVTVVFKTLLQLVQERLNRFPLRDVLNFNCWLSTIRSPPLTAYGAREAGVLPSAALEELAASAARMNMKIACLNCTSPRMPELVEVSKTAEAQQDFTDVVNDFLDYISASIGGNYLQVQLDRLLNESAYQCPHSPEYDPDFKVSTYEAFPYSVPDNDSSGQLLVMLLVIALSVIVALAILIFAITFFVRRRHKKWLQSLPSDQLHRLAIEQQSEDNEKAKINAATQSMFKSPHIPLLLRLSMPVILLCNIAFFLSGHLSLGGTVNIVANIAGEEVTVDNFFEFSMARSTVDIWNAGGKELAILILIFSGIWPYTKQLITLTVWFLPPSRLSVSRRESILLWLDRLGKWSMIDIFVLVITIAAFRVSIVSPNVMFVPNDFYSVDLLVVPLWGLYANMIAQLISQVTSHFIIYYHRRIVREAVKGLDKSEGYSERDFGEFLKKKRGVLWQHEFGRPHRGEREKLVVRPWVNVALPLVALCVVACIIVGCIIPSFSLEILGMIGVAVESGQEFEEAKIYHSVLTVIQLLMNEAIFLDTVWDYIGLGTLCVLTVWTVLLVPITQVVVLLRQWFGPTTGKGKVFLSAFIEILQAWQYAEVYLIAVFVATWQLGPISEFMINDYCESLEGFFAELVNYGLLAEEDAQCFSVNSSIEVGSYIMLAGALLLAFLNPFVYKAVVQYFRDLKEFEKRGKIPHIALGSDESLRQSKIHPNPVLFSDSFRWFLKAKGEDDESEDQ